MISESRVYALKLFERHENIIHTTGLIFMNFLSVFDGYGSESG
jgi:hypothetical protein